jgi:hypothetical protein
METISNAVSAVTETATKAIWGEQPNNETGGSEPVSGVQGKGTSTEPYDAGNSGTTLRIVCLYSVSKLAHTFQWRIPR